MMATPMGDDDDEDEAMVMLFLSPLTAFRSGDV